MLKKILKNKPFCNEFHFLLFAVILLLLSIYQPIFCFILAIYLLFIKKKTKYILPICILLFSVFISYNFSKNKLKELKAGEYEGIYEVVDVEKNAVIIKGDTKIIIFSAADSFTPGDIISARVKVYKLAQASFEGDFDSKGFYEAKGITNRGKFLQYEVIQSKWGIARVRHTILRYYESHLKEKSFTYLKALFFGISDFDKEVKSAYSLLYLSHLLAISGFHIHFLFSCFLYFFQKVFHIKGEKISVCIIGFYVFFFAPN